MNTEILSAYLVEDEPLCRADFRQTLGSFPQVRLLGETDKLSVAERFLATQPVDLLFLDLSVGRDNGLDLIERLPYQPLVIALTAHPQHAVRGFSLDLVDYILKPVEPPRLRSALEKARQRKLASRLQPERITFVAELEGKKFILSLDEILGAESLGNYVLLHTLKGKAVKRSTFKDVCKKLPPSLFLDTGRGRWVAIRHVRSWKRNPGGKLSLQLGDNSELSVSQNKTSGVLRRLKSKLAT